MQEEIQTTYSVYWIHNDTHTDPKTEGYIGVSKNVTKSWAQHKTDAKCKRHANKYLEHAINKYQDALIYEIIAQGTEEFCFSYEKELRPEPSIGWNLMSGGPVGKITEEGKEKLSEASKKRVKTPEQKWQFYKKKNPFNMTYAEYLECIITTGYKKTEDIEEALLAYREQVETKIPKNKSNLPVFSLELQEEYENIEAAANANDICPSTIFKSCESKSGKWVYLKNL